MGGEREGCLPSLINSGNLPTGEERDDLKGRGGLLEDGALLLPVARKRRGVVQGASARVLAVVSPAGLG